MFRFEFYLIDASLDTLDTVMTSTIVINGQARNLSAPPLNIKVRTYVDYDFPVEPPDDSWQSASEFWSNTGASPWQWFEWIVGQDSLDPLYTYNDVLIEEPTVEKTGRCIAEDAYSWGFSSLLLLTFCCYTIAFALALILLQTDIYWNTDTTATTGLTPSTPTYSTLRKNSRTPSATTSRTTCNRPRHSRNG